MTQHRTRAHLLAAAHPQLPPCSLRSRPKMSYWTRRSLSMRRASRSSILGIGARALKRSSPTIFSTGPSWSGKCGVSHRPARWKRSSSSTARRGRHRARRQSRSQRARSRRATRGDGYRSGAHPAWRRGGRGVRTPGQRKSENRKLEASRVLTHRTGRILRFDVRWP